MIICENRVGVTGTDRQCLALADGRHHRRFFKSPQPSARLYENTVSQGCESCLLPPRQGMPREIGRLAVTSATGQSKAFSTRLLSNTTRPSPPIWRSGGRSCQAMCNANSRITSNAGGWNMAFCGCAASRVTSSTWLPSPVVRSGRLSAVPAQDAMKVDVNENLG